MPNEELKGKGFNRISKHIGQSVIGEFNTEDPSTASASDRGDFIEIAGNGTSDEARSNARTLDWAGNETISGTFKANCLTDGNITKTMTEVLSGSGPIRPTTYVKNVSATGNNLAFTKIVDGTESTVTYQPDFATKEQLTTETSERKSADTTLQENINKKSTVSVSGTGTSTNTVSYITINGNEYKLAGGGGGISDYADLTNKPKIENVELKAGNNTAESLNLTTKTDFDTHTAKLASKTDYGHVKLYEGDVSAISSYNNGIAASSCHNHDAKYLLSSGNIAISGTSETPLTLTSGYTEEDVNIALKAKDAINPYMYLGADSENGIYYKTDTTGTKLYMLDEADATNFVKKKGENASITGSSGTTPLELTSASTSGSDNVYIKLKNNATDSANCITGYIGVTKDNGTDKLAFYNGTGNVQTFAITGHTHDQYLPKVGNVTIEGESSSETPLTVWAKNDSDVSQISFKSGSTIPENLGCIGVDTTGLYWTDDGVTKLRYLDDAVASNFVKKKENASIEGDSGITPLTLKSASTDSSKNVYIELKNNDSSASGCVYGNIGVTKVNGTNKLAFYNGVGDVQTFALSEHDHDDKYISKIGGATITSAIGQITPLTVNSNVTGVQTSQIAFENNYSALGNIGVTTDETHTFPYFSLNDSSEKLELLTEGDLSDYVRNDKNASISGNKGDTPLNLKSADASKNNAVYIHLENKASSTSEDYVHGYLGVKKIDGTCKLVFYNGHGDVQTFANTSHTHDEYLPRVGDVVIESSDSSETPLTVWAKNESSVSQILFKSGGKEKQIPIGYLGMDANDGVYWAIDNVYRHYLIDEDDATNFVKKNENASITGNSGDIPLTLTSATDNNYPLIKLSNKSGGMSGYLGLTNAGGLTLGVKKNSSDTLVPLATKVHDHGDQYLYANQPVTVNTGDKLTITPLTLYANTSSDNVRIAFDAKDSSGAVKHLGYLGIINNDDDDKIYPYFSWDGSDESEIALAEDFVNKYENAIIKGNSGINTLTLRSANSSTGTENIANIKLTNKAGNDGGYIGFAEFGDGKTRKLAYKKNLTTENWITFAEDGHKHTEYISSTAATLLGQASPAKEPLTLVSASSTKNLNIPFQTSDLTYFGSIGLGLENLLDPDSEILPYYIVDYGTGPDKIFLADRDHDHDNSYASKTSFNTHTKDTSLHKTAADIAAIAKVVPNTVNNAGYVAAPTTTGTNKVWKTDNTGAPAWRDDTASNATKLTSVRKDWQKTELIDNKTVETKYVIVKATGSNVETMVGNIPATDSGGESYLMNARTVLYFLPIINGDRKYQCDSTFYAPTTSGNSGQVLRSNGSGKAPTWASSFPTNYLYLHSVTLTISSGEKICLSIYSIDNNKWESFDDIWAELYVTYSTDEIYLPGYCYSNNGKHYKLEGIKATNNNKINISWIVGSTDTMSYKTCTSANTTVADDDVHQL